jgi:uncharacterized membrane protein YedE/YeeE
MGAVATVGAGFLFAIGLALSGMTQPGKVIGFLDFFGKWDPSLAFVMGGAVGVYFWAYRVIAGRGRALSGSALPEVPRSRIDVRLIGGALLFGIGWGLSGFCPGPALVSVGAAAPAALWFVPAMAAGVVLYQLVGERSR